MDNEILLYCKYLPMNAVHDFLLWTHDHIKGDEKGEAQIFLDRFFRAAYGMKAKDDVLEFLLTLNKDCAAQEARGEQITPPGLPSAFASGKAAKEFVSEDCVRMWL